MKILFALGPARSPDTKERRAEVVFNASAPALHALRWGTQIHGRVVASIGEEAGRPLRGAACVGRCDALITAESGIGLLVWTADCVPILLAGDGVVAAVHAGWRGTAADIVGSVVRRFQVEYGVAPDNLRAVLGPAISGAHYRVGTEVIDALRALKVDEDRWRNRQFVDLRHLLVARLEKLGLLPDAIERVGPCTAASPRLASFRRDGQAAGRQWSLIYRTAAPPA
ncbi:MAG: polyphenol oxidase family protein [Thermoanaerobaculales bacterium]